jgi:hypothetical protein
MTTPDPNAFLMGGGVPSAKFEQVGDTLSGTIANPPQVRQQTDFTTGKPLFWDSDGSPRMQLVVQVQTTQRDPQRPDDDGVRGLYVKGQMQVAVRDAVRKAGASGLEVGGTLTVSFIGHGASKNGGQPPKNYAATYQAPNVSAAFLGTTTAQPAATNVSNLPQQAAGEDPDAAYLRTKGIDPSTVGDIHHVAALQRQLEQSIAS